jgi:hypothetical protein
LGRAIWMTRSSAACRKKNWRSFAVCFADAERIMALKVDKLPGGARLQAPGRPRRDPDGGRKEAAGLQFHMTALCLRCRHWRHQRLCLCPRHVRFAASLRCASII